MIGGCNPSDRQITSIVPRIVALAMCLQFQVADVACLDVDGRVHSTGPNVTSTTLHCRPASPIRPPDGDCAA
jgi:hypothetical protein